MLLALGIARAFLKRNDTGHWLGQGKALAILTAAVGMLAAVLDAKFGGASWAGVIVTLVAAVKLLVSPTAKA